MKYKKILFFLIGCIILLSATIITYAILSKDMEETSANVATNESISNTQNISENIIQNNKNDEENENNNQVSEEVENKSNTEVEKHEEKKEAENENESEESNGEEDIEETEQSKKSKEEKVLDLVNEEWGEDESVYYTIDRNVGNKYYVSVRSKQTTQTLAEYEVDLEKETVELV